MSIEHEIKILNIDIEKARDCLSNLQFSKVKDLEFRRYVYDVIPTDSDAWIRLRTDGHTTTLAYKKTLKNTIDGMNEIEVTVDDFETAHQVLVAAGFRSRGYQENKRILFTGFGCEVSIDIWPMIPPYLEIEAPTADEVAKCLKILIPLLGTATTSLPTQEIYKRHGMDLSAIQNLTF